MRSPKKFSKLRNVCNKMKFDWDRRARENARRYIATESWETEEEFDRIGLRDTQILLKGIKGQLDRHMRVLDIGCGMGRMDKHVAPLVGELHGVDVSGEMIRLAKQRLANLPNVYFHETNGRDLRIFDAETFDFVFSYITFQHIPRPIVYEYIREVHRVLKKDGLFRFQVLDLQRRNYREPPDDETYDGRSYSIPELRGLAKQNVFEIVGLEIAQPYEDDKTIQFVWATYRKA